MPLRAHIPHLKYHVSRQLALEVEIILSRILRADIGLKLPKHQDRPEYGPVDRLTTSRIQYSIEWIRIDRTVLTFKGSIEEGF